MSDLSPLHNRGSHIVGSSDSGDKTIVVLGVARSGTSAIAGVLAHLGYYMGETSKPPVFEDHLGQILDDGDFPTARTLISSYNDQFSEWGFKRPSSIEHLDFLHAELRNPRYIVVFRDIFAIANRNRISMAAGLDDNMASSLASYAQLTKFLRDQKPHALLVSHEKTSNPSELVSEIVSFCESSATEEQVKAASEFIVPNPSTYLNVSRSTLTQGYVGVASPMLVKGWARYVSHERPATVELTVDGEVVAQTVANLLRPDLKRNGRHSKGACGFRFEFTDDNLLEIGSEIRVRVVDEVRDLRGSPVRVKLKPKQDS